MPPDPRVLQVAEKIVCLHMAQIRGGNPVTLIIGDKSSSLAFIPIPAGDRKPDAKGERRPSPSTFIIQPRYPSAEDIWPVADDLASWCPDELRPVEKNISPSNDDRTVGEFMILASVSKTIGNTEIKRQQRRLSRCPQEGSIPVSAL